MLKKIVVPILFLLLVLVSKSAFSLDLYQEALPQDTTKTCQSYAAMLALAAKDDPKFSIKTFGDLNKYEKEFRKILEKSGKPYEHSQWSKAMEKLTKNKYTLKRQYKHNNVIDWINDVSKKTTVISNLDFLLNQLLGKEVKVVLTSVKSIDDNQYKTGHIVSVIGFTGNNLNSNTKMIVFNSAIKNKQCFPRTAKASQRYSAGVTETNSFELKGFPNNYLTMTLVKK